MTEKISVPKIYLDLIDQLFELERKVETLNESNTMSRNINRMKDIFANFSSTGSDVEAGLTYHNPLDEPYNETRTDLEVSIAGSSTENLLVTEVIKPIIRYRQGGLTAIVRKGIVVVESRN